MNDQKDIFLKSEGNNWFLRNQEHPAVLDMKSDPIVKAIEQWQLGGKDTLEIGCSNGFRPAFLSTEFASRMSGIDPSSKAIEEGLEKFPFLNLKVGTADLLPFPDNSFDVVIYGFCLYLCDRKDLFSIASECNRVLKNNGHIIIMDFLSFIPYFNPYHHLEGLKSYKMEYSSLFTWNPEFTLLQRTMLPHPDAGMNAGPDQMISIDVIRKNSEAYIPNPFK
ncbi:MAG: methyltransferase domain-containing protein [Bacteroidetes bacterium]|nr:methyltransferase domain-containing protein [Bacteroidota bacterium]